MGRRFLGYLFPTGPVTGLSGLGEVSPAQRRKALESAAWFAAQPVPTLEERAEARRRVVELLGYEYTGPSMAEVFGRRG